MADKMAREGVAREVDIPLPLVAGASILAFFCENE